MRPQLFLVPNVDICTVEPDLARQRVPNAHEQACQRRLARSRWANHPQHTARGQAKLHPPQNGLGLARCRRSQRLHNQLPFGRRQLHVVRPGRHLLQERFKPRPRRRHTDQGTPLLHHLGQRRKQTPRQHRADDHHRRATMQGVVQQQPGPQPQQHRPHELLQQLGDGIEATCSLRSAGLKSQKSRLLFLPLGHHRRHHAHGLHDLGVAQRCLCIDLRFLGSALGFEQRLARSPLNQPGDKSLHHGTQQGCPAQQRVDQEDEHDGQHGHRHFKHGAQGGVVEKFAHGAKVVLHQQCVAHLLFEQAIEHRLIDAAGHLQLKLHPQTPEHLRADLLQHLHHGVSAEGHQGNHHQRRHVAAVDHPVVDLQHVRG